jgi:AcrR family transcriptional regulator
MVESRTVNTAREQRILDAAARLVIHYGYDKTTVSDIAREAGVSKGAIYLHYPSKEDLFEALLEREVMSYSDDWLARFEADDSEWSFSGMFRLMLLTMQDHPFMVAIFKRDAHVFGSFLRRDSTILQQKGAANAQLFGMLQSVGAMRADIDPPVIAYLLNAFAYGLVTGENSISADDMPPFEAVIDGLAKLLDRGLAPEDGGNREAAKALVQQVSLGLRQQWEKRRQQQQ